ncbi:hypothetical protein JCM24511_07806 [Saitozyma sp. JCM 24511]|nr:hypothetical protein JCM24511_07806 [Saitozyma sp. JCM 24511]
MPAPHPLRRISTGSLSTLARSQDRAHSSPSGLDFLQPAITELADEAATLSTNIQRLNDLHDALGTFNEAFAGWMYALKMNAFCVEFPESEMGSGAASKSGGIIIFASPTDGRRFGGDVVCWVLAVDEILEQTGHRQGSNLAELSWQDQPSWMACAAAAAAATASIASPPVRPPSPSAAMGNTAPHPVPNPADMTYATAYSSTIDEPAPPPKPVAKEPVAKKGVSAVVKRKRELEIAAIIDTLPLEYRGRDPAARLGMEKIIHRLMESPTGLTIKDFVVLPDLPQPKVNKHLIALVSKKLVTKNNNGGTFSYKWVGA